MESINKEDLVRKNKSELISLAEKLGIKDELSFLSKAQIIDKILLESEKEVAAVDTSYDSVFSLELARRKSKFSHGVSNISDVSNAAFVAELAKRSSKFNSGYNKSINLDVAFSQELSKRELKSR